MNQSDWISEAPATSKPFKDLPNMRPGIAQEKAQLCYRLGELCNKVPLKVRNGSVQAVREWRKEREKAMKVAGNKRASVFELTAAVSTMERFA